MSGCWSGMRSMDRRGVMHGLCLQKRHAHSDGQQAPWQRRGTCMPWQGATPSAPQPALAPPGRLPGSSGSPRGRPATAQMAPSRPLSTAGQAGSQGHFLCRLHALPACAQVSSVATRSSGLLSILQGAPFALTFSPLTPCRDGHSHHFCIKPTGPV